MKYSKILDKLLHQIEGIEFNEDNRKEFVDRKINEIDIDLVNLKGIKLEGYK